MPDQKRKEFQRLVDKYLNGEATQAEREALDKYFLLFSEKPEYLRLLNEDQLAKLEQRMENALFKRIKSPAKVKRMWPRIAAAASIILGLSSVYFIFHKRAIQQFAQNPKEDVAPGNKNAILKVGNGKIIVLTNSVTGKLAQVGGLTINKTRSGTIDYVKRSQLDYGSKVVYDTLINPAGSKIYHLNLSDGSKLLVNAATTLCFPENFEANRKIIILKGEVYFNVIYNPASPFTTTAKGQTITDLGTHFNVSAYEDEPNSIVTLVEGSVRLNLGENKMKLAPGQQAISSTNSIAVKNVDTEDAIAWTTGNFMFDGDNLKEVMKKIARWYDVTVVYEDPDQANQVIGGGITMFTNMSKVLEALQKASNVRFKIEGRKITVMK